MQIVLAIVVAFGVLVAHAEVLELEGTVKAVDATARSITIERKNPKGTKTLELEVTKKAGDLSSVKAGDSISFSYDPDLEVVTRLGGAAKGDSPTSQKVLRVSFSISETGECSLRLEPASPMAGGTSLTEQDDGIWRCQHDFTKSSDIELFEGHYCRAVNVRVDQARKLLMFEAAPAEGFEREASQAIYQCRFRVPLQVSLDLVITGRRYMFQLNPMPAGQQGQKQAVISISSNDAPSGETTVEVASMSRDLQGKAFFDQPLVKRQVIHLDEPWEKSFRLPVPNVRSKDIYMLGLGTVGESVLGVASLTLSGIPAPSLGMRLGEKSGMVFVEAVTPGSLAERTGIKAGDVLLSIREKHPANMTEAVELLADMTLNERSEMTFQRANTKRTFVLTPTFGK